MALLQSANLPPAQPSYVLRGHNAQIHSVCFVRHNTRLLTGDADGWLVLWNLASKRPVAVWKGHAASILGLSSWGADKLVTHGRDNRLLIWQLSESDESTFSVVLPIEDSVTKRHEPWLLHALPVNTLNFCSLSACEVSSPVVQQLPGDTLLVAVPGNQEGDVDVYSLPSKQRLSTIHAPKNVKLGMVMCLKVLIREDHFLVIAGYESGHSCLWKRAFSQSQCTLLSTTKAHSQPILSLDVAFSLGRYYTSAADDVIASHSFTEPTPQPVKQTQTKHSGQQALQVRSDDKIFATAGWDGRVRVYSVKTMKELAVLKFHREGCYALAFADLKSQDSVVSKPENEASGESQLDKSALQTVEQKRNLKAQTTHWLAAGSKDGKVSLWDIY